MSDCLFSFFPSLSLIQVCFSRPSTESAGAIAARVSQGANEAKMRCMWTNVSNFTLPITNLTLFCSTLSLSSFRVHSAIWSAEHYKGSTSSSCFHWYAFICVWLDALWLVALVCLRDLFAIKILIVPVVLIIIIIFYATGPAGGQHQVLLKAVGQPVAVPATGGQAGQLLLRRRKVRRAGAQEETHIYLWCEIEWDNDLLKNMFSSH